MSFETVIAVNKYGLYCVPRSSSDISPAARKVVNGEVCEEDTIQCILDRCGNGDIIHAGAYFGDFLPALSNGCRGQVWAFEPKKEHFFCAMETIRLNQLGNVVLKHAGLGNKYENRYLWVKTDDGRVYGAGSRIIDEEKPEDQIENVQIVTLDSFIPSLRDVSVIHLDIEGFEPRALNGALGIIYRDKPVLILETLPSQEWIEEYLSPLGYRVTMKVGMINTVFEVTS